MSSSPATVAAPPHAVYLEALRPSASPSPNRETDASDTMANRAAREGTHEYSSGEPHRAVTGAAAAPPSLPPRGAFSTLYAAGINKQIGGQTTMPDSGSSRAHGVPALDTVCVSSTTKPDALLDVTISLSSSSGSEKEGEGAAGSERHSGIPYGTQDDGQQQQQQPEGLNDEDADDGFSPFPRWPVETPTERANGDQEALPKSGIQSRSGGAADTILRKEQTPVDTTQGSSIPLLNLNLSPLATADAAPAASDASASKMTKFDQGIRKSPSPHRQTPKQASSIINNHINKSNIRSLSVPTTGRNSDSRSNLGVSSSFFSRARNSAVRAASTRALSSPRSHDHASRSPNKDTSNNNNNDNSNDSNGYDDEEELDPFMRLYAQAQEREERLQQRRSEERDRRRSAEAAACTFRPHLAATDTRASPAKSHNTSRSRTGAADGDGHRERSPRQNQNDTEVSSSRRNSHSAEDSGFCQKEESPFERLYKEASEMETRAARRREQEQRSRAAAAEAECTFQPSITDGKRLGGAGGYASFNQFLAAQEADLERRERRQKEIESKVYGDGDAGGSSGRAQKRRPTNPALEKRLVEEKGYQGPVAGWHERFEAFARRREEGGDYRRGSPNRSTVSGGGVRRSYSNNGRSTSRHEGGRRQNGLATPVRQQQQQEQCGDDAHRRPGRSASGVVTPSRSGAFSGAGGAVAAREGTSAAEGWSPRPHSAQSARQWSARTPASPAAAAAVNVSGMSPASGTRKRCLSSSNVHTRLYGLSLKSPGRSGAGDNYGNIHSGARGSNASTSIITSTIYGNAPRVVSPRTAAAAENVCRHRDLLEENNSSVVSFRPVTTHTFTGEDFLKSNGAGSRRRGSTPRRSASVSSSSRVVSGVAAKKSEKSASADPSASHTPAADGKQTQGGEEREQSTSNVAKMEPSESPKPSASTTATATSKSPRLTAFQRLEALYRDGALRAERLKQKQREAEAARAAAEMTTGGGGGGGSGECTFKPAINPRSRAIAAAAATAAVRPRRTDASGSTHVAAATSASSPPAKTSATATATTFDLDRFETRLQQQEERRRAHLDALAQQRAAHRTEGCTFRPELNHTSVLLGTRAAARYVDVYPDPWAAAGGLPGQTSARHHRSHHPNSSSGGGGPVVSPRRRLSSALSAAATPSSAAAVAAAPDAAVPENNSGGDTVDSPEKRSAVSVTQTGCVEAVCRCSGSFKRVPSPIVDSPRVAREAE